jgi:hypothetical protein
MAKTNLKKQILTALGLDKKIELEWQAKLTDGTIVVSSAPELEAGVDIGILTEDGTVMPLPIGSYETDEGVGFTVEEDGIVFELLTEEEEAPSEETEEEATEEVEANAHDMKQVKKLIIEVVRAAMKEMKSENQKLSRQIRRLSSTPSGDKVSFGKFRKSTGGSKEVLSTEDYNKLSKLDRFNYNLQK